MITPALTWLDERLAIQDTTTDIAMRDVHRQQAAANVSVRNIITSLRLLSDVMEELLSGSPSTQSCGRRRLQNHGLPTRTL
jgi:hypothetical protein